MTIPEMLERSCDRWTNKVAFKMKAGAAYRTLTYGEFRNRVREVAAGLVALGLRKGDTVAIIGENSFEWAIAYYAQSVAGGVGVPLYYELKPQEIEELLGRSAARFAIVSSRVFERLQGAIPLVETVIVIGESVETKTGAQGGFLRRARPDVIPFDQLPARATDESRRQLESTRVDPDDLASVVFTSGTTAGMKGVMLTHRNFMSNVAAVPYTLPVSENDRLLLVLPLHHAFPFMVGMLTLIALGGEVTLENDLARIRDRMVEVRPTIIAGVPALFELMYRAIVQRIEAEGQKKRFETALRVADLVKRRTGVNIAPVLLKQVHDRLGGSVRFMVSGGAALSPETARNYLRLGLIVLQGWGMTEASPVIAAQRYSPNRFRFTDYYEKQLGSVGKPLPGIEVKLIDVPEKEIYVQLHGEGELIARGPNVSPGYWKAPEETRNAKLGDWLRTGDLGRIDSDGNIYITGRAKYVIVLESGEKVVPDELESKLAESDLIEDVCVLPRKVRDKTVAGAVIYPNFEAVRTRARDAGIQLSDGAVRKLIAEELDRLSAEVAAYKRITDFALSDVPLPKTALRKVARGRVTEPRAFDMKRWERVAHNPTLLEEEPANPPLSGGQASA